jgi:hypothetical protein
MPALNPPAASMPESLEIRPKGVVVVSVFLYAGTAVALLTATMILWPGIRFDWPWKLNEEAHAGFEILGNAAAVLLGLIAALTFVAARGLMQRKRWAWWLAVGIFAVNVAGDLVRVVTGDWLRGAAGLAIGGAFLVYLARPGVKRCFAL